MNASTQRNARALFGLDFALRGHRAYADPLDLDTLIALVERMTVRTGAPLLRYVEDCAKRDSHRR